MSELVKSFIELQKEELSAATFAGGCFWCMVAPFEAEDGVLSTSSGYTGGDFKNPTYEDVCSGKTGHYEAIRIVFDPKLVSYERLLQIFWMNIDPTQIDGQFADIGSHYRTCIFYYSDEQKKAAILSKDELQKSGKFLNPIVTDIKEAKTFYAAEDYHQDFYKKSTPRYTQYRSASGRDQFIEKKWGKKDNK